MKVYNEKCIMTYAKDINFMKKRIIYLLYFIDKIYNYPQQSNVYTNTYAKDIIFDIAVYNEEDIYNFTSNTDFYLIKKRFPLCLLKSLDYILVLDYMPYKYSTGYDTEHKEKFKNISILKVKL